MGFLLDIQFKKAVFLSLLGILSFSVYVALRFQFLYIFVLFTAFTIIISLLLLLLVQRSESVLVYFLLIALFFFLLLFSGFTYITRFTLDWYIFHISLEGLYNTLQQFRSTRFLTVSFIIDSLVLPLVVGLTIAYVVHTSRVGDYNQFTRNVLRVLLVSSIALIFVSYAFNDILLVENALVTIS